MSVTKIQQNFFAPDINGYGHCPSIGTRSDGKKYCEYQFPDMIIVGSPSFEQSLEKALQEKKRLDVLVYIDNTKSLAMSQFSVLAQLQRLIEITSGRGMNLRISVSYFSDGKEHNVLPILLMDNDGQAKLVEAILSIPFAGNYGGTTIGEAIKDAREVSANLGPDSHKAILIFTDEEGGKVTDGEKMEIARTEAEGHSIFLIDRPMSFLKSKDSKMMGRPESVQRVVELLNKYKDYKGSQDLINRFESEKSFLLKLAFALSLKRDKEDPADLSFNIFWDPRFHCSEGSNCLEGLGWFYKLDEEKKLELIPSGEVLWQNGALELWRGTENYYYNLYQLILTTKDAQEAQKIRLLLTYDLLKTYLDDIRREDPSRTIKDISRFVNVIDIRLDFFSIDPITLVQAILINNGELLEPFETTVPLYNTKNFFNNSLALPYDLSRAYFSNYIKNQFEKHDKGWGREQLDKIAKLIDARLDLSMYHHAYFFVFLLHEMPELRNSPLVARKVDEFINHCKINVLEQGKNNLLIRKAKGWGEKKIDKEITFKPGLNFIILSLLFKEGLITDKHKAGLTHQYIKVVSDGKEPAGTAEEWLLALPDKGDIDYFIDHYKGTDHQVYLFEKYIVTAMTMEQMEGMLEKSKRGEFEILIDRPDVLVKLGPEDARSIMKKILPKGLYSPNDIITLLLNLRRIKDSALVYQRLIEGLRQYRWPLETELMFRFMNDLENDRIEEAIDMLFTKLKTKELEFEDLEVKYYTSKGWSSIPHYNIPEHFTIAQALLSLPNIPHERVAKAVTKYLLDGDNTQKVLAHHILNGEILKKLRYPVEQALLRFQGQFDKILADFIRTHVETWEEKASFLGSMVTHLNPEICFNNPDQVWLLETMISSGYLYRYQYLEEAKKHGENIDPLSFRFEMIWMQHNKLVELFNKIAGTINKSFPLADLPFTKGSGFGSDMRIVRSEILYNLVLPALSFGKDDDGEHGLVKETVTPVLAEWLALAREYSDGNFLGDMHEKLFKTWHFTGNDYVIMADEAYKHYYKDVNYNWFISTLLDEFVLNQPQSYGEYAHAVLTGSSYSEEFKDTILDYLFKPITSETNTKQQVYQRFDKKENKVVKDTSPVLYECGPTNSEGCNVLSSILKGMVKILLDGAVPLKYRKKIIYHLHYISIKFDLSKQGINLKNIYNKLKTDTEMREMIQYYLKKIESFKPKEEIHKAE